MHSLLIDWPRLVAALVLLLTPGGLFHGRKVRYRPISRDWDRHWRQMLALGLHTIDLLRAALGTWLLLQAVAGPLEARGPERYLPLLVQGAICVLAVLAQMLVCKERGAVNAPFTFVVGLLLAGVSPLSGLIALALALPLAMGARSAGVFLPVLAFAFLLSAFLFGGRAVLPNAGIEAVAVLVPWLWSLLFRRELVIAYRLRRDENHGTHSPLR